MSTLVIEGLRAAVDGREILTGVDLQVPAGKVHALRGPDGSGRSTLAHVIAGRPGYEVLEGSVRIDDVELLDTPAWQRVEAGLFLAMQDPIEVPGVALRELLTASVRTPSDPAEVGDRLRAEAERSGVGAPVLDRPLSADLSDDERMRTETLQLGVLRPTFAILDELDSGLDAEALAVVSGRIEESRTEDGLGVLVIPISNRRFEGLKPDRVHVFAEGRIQESGGRELAAEVEENGYERWVAAPTTTDDPIADPPA